VYGLFSGVGLLLVSINAEHFGLQSLGTITVAIIFGNNIGGAPELFLAGYIYDAIGNYLLAFLLCWIAGIAAGIVIWLVKPGAKQKL
jgi:hypothetical protein